MTTPRHTAPPPPSNEELARQLATISTRLEAVWKRLDDPNASSSTRSTAESAYRPRLLNWMFLASPATTLLDGSSRSPNSSPTIRRLRRRESLLLRFILTAPLSRGTSGCIATAKSCPGTSFSRRWRHVLHLPRSMTLEGSFSSSLSPPP